MIFIKPLILSFLFAYAFTAVGQTPKFSSYPAGKPYNGKNARAIIGKDDRTYRTRLRWAAKYGSRNFAGEYILGQIGCGAACRVTFALNAKTGHLAWLPFTLCCWQPDDVDVSTDATTVRLNSRLIILRGLRNEGNDAYAGDAMTDTHYYQIKNGEFIFIKTIKK